MTSAYSNSMRCKWVKWEVIGDNELRLTVPPGEWPGEMTGCFAVVAIAQTLMPTVKSIYVYDGKYSWTYTLNGNEWIREYTD